MAKKRQFKQSRTDVCSIKRKPKWVLWLINGLYVFGGIFVTTLFALVVATAVIPTLGMWLHSQLLALLADQQLGLVGMVGMWLMPFAFLVLLIGLGCAKAIKELWVWIANCIKRAWANNEPSVRETAVE